jgi:hypothetical protein
VAFVSFSPGIWRDALCRRRRLLVLGVALCGLGHPGVAARAGDAGTAAEQFHRAVEPLLATYCYDCHGNGAAEGSVTLDGFESDTNLLEKPELWTRALRMMRADMMPPVEAAQPNSEELAKLEQWIKREALGLDPNHPDPGRVTVRRLNRAEYRNTVRDLLGVDFDAQSQFPPDDAGHGFDNMSDVLTVSPLLLEKYIVAAETIVAKAVPLSPDARNYERFFPRDVPKGERERRAYAEELMGLFATKAYRRRVDQETAKRLGALAESVYSQRGQNFESGIAQAMAAVLASPRFLFREETLEEDPAQPYPLVDEYALATRLSYFLWSSMPDAELMKLAREHRLRSNLSEQVERMMEDRKFDAFIEQFAGQWLRARDVETALVDAKNVLARENPDARRERLRDRFRQFQRRDPDSLSDEERAEFEEVRREFRRRFDELQKSELTGELRRAMKRETEMTFGRIMREDRDLLELVDADYTYLNGRLARHYGIPGVRGDRMQLVSLAADSVRGGVLTQGTTLVVTSNPDRTSPAKRGLWVLETLLGVPPPPPPPNIPSLELAEKSIKDHPPTARELLERHRADPACAACHNRIDPLGLGLENFNALGIWRDAERKQPIDAAGELITGETFTSVEDLKTILKTTRKRDFYRCAAEKLLTYALGRGLESYDVETVDQIVERVEAADGRAWALVMGVIESAPFQRTRRPGESDATAEVATRTESSTESTVE